MNNSIHTSVADIETCLREALAPTYLEIQCESDEHIGHAGHQQGGHYAVAISSAAFDNLSLVACHRLIYQALGERFKQGIHALRIEIVR